MKQTLQGAFVMIVHLINDIRACALPPAFGIMQMDTTHTSHEVKCKLFPVNF